MIQVNTMPTYFAVIDGPEGHFILTSDNYPEVIQLWFNRDLVAVGVSHHFRKLGIEISADDVLTGRTGDFQVTIHNLEPTLIHHDR